MIFTNLPKAWYFKLHKENAEAICNFVTSLKPSYTNWTPHGIAHNSHITNDGELISSTKNTYGVEITFEDFEKYVLNKSKEFSYEIY